MPRRLPWLIGILAAWRLRFVLKKATKIQRSEALMEAILVVATLLLEYRQGETVRSPKSLKPSEISMRSQVCSVSTCMSPRWHMAFLASYGAAHLKHSLQSLELDSARRKLNGLLGLVIESVTRAVVAVWTMNVCGYLDSDHEVSWDCSLVVWHKSTNKFLPQELTRTEKSVIIFSAQVCCRLQSRMEPLDQNAVASIGSRNSMRFRSGEGYKTFSCSCKLVF